MSCLLFCFEALKMQSLEAGAQNVKDKFVPAIESSVKFWTGISFVNYALVPVHLRPVYVSCWSIVWQSYLSYVSNNKNSTGMLSALAGEEETAEENLGSLKLLH